MKTPRIDMVGKFPFLGNGKAIALGEAEGLVKTVFDAKTGELTESELIEIIFPHPTLSEMMHESVLDAFGRVIHF